MIDGKIIELSNRLVGKGSFKKIGEGQHGIALLNNKNGLLYKLTKKNSPEFMIASNLKNMNLSTLPNILAIKTISDVGVYVRKKYNPISDNLSNLISENLEEIADFFDERRNFNAKKSETNLSFEFDDDFLDFLTQLKRDLHKLRLLPYDWDIDGLPLNTYLDNNNNYILVDF